MAVTLNAKGTSVSSFTIGKGGQAITLNANGYLTIDDGVDTEQPIGYNTIPIYEIDANDTFDLAHAGMMWHKDAGGAVTFTCDNDSTIPQGSTWIVHNDDAEDITIAQGTGVTIAFLASGAAPTTGDVTVSQGGIVTVYKYTDTEYWVWGDDGPFNILTAGSTTDATLRWNGSAWAENTTVTITSTGVVTAASTAGNHTFSVDSATTNADIPVLKLSATSTGTPAAGIGPSIQFEAETAAGAPGNLEIGGEIALEATDVTATTEDFDFVFNLMSAGAAATEVFRISSTGTLTSSSLTDNRVLIAGTGGIIEDDANLTWDGTSLNIRTQKELRLYNTANDEYAYMNYDGAAFRIRRNAVGTELFIVDNFGGGFLVNSNGNSKFFVDIPNSLVQIDDGYALRIEDSTSADYADFQHDGTDFNTTFGGTATTDWNISGLANTVKIDNGASGAPVLQVLSTTNPYISYGTSSGYVMGVTSTGSLQLESGSAAGAGITLIAGGGATGQIALQANGTRWAEVRGDGAFRINDSTLADYGDFSHDGTDFNTAFTNTTEWNITGLSTGITFDNVVSKKIEYYSGYQVGVESSTLWHRSNTIHRWYIGSGPDGGSTDVMELQVGGLDLDLTLSNATNTDVALQVVYEVNKATSGDDYGLLVQKTDTASPGTSYLGMFRVSTADKLAILDDGTLRIHANTAESDYVDFSHDGTDFNIAGTLTTDINMTSGITAVNLPEITLTTALDETYGGTGQTTLTTGDLLYASGANTFGKLALGNVGEVLTVVGSNVAWNPPAVIEFAYDSTVTAADPGAGTIRFDSVTIGSIANAYIDDLDASGDNAEWILSNLADGDILTFRSITDSADYIIASVNGTPTDGTGYWTVPLTLIHTGTIFTNGDQMRVSVEWAGSNASVSGFISGTVANDQIVVGTGASSVDSSANLTYNGTTLTMAGAGAQLLLPLENDATTPTLAFGDGDTGFYELSDDTIRVAIGTSALYQFDATHITGTGSASFYLRNTTVTDTNPSLGPRRDTNTGIGSAENDSMSLIAGGVEHMRFDGVTGGQDHIKAEVPFYMDERVAALNDYANYGQLWVRNDAPNTLMYTDDAGNDFTANNVFEIAYVYSSAVTSTDPGAGTLNFNSVTIGSITTVYIDDLDDTGRDNSYMLSTLADGDLIEFRSASDPADYIVATVNGAPTDSTGFWTISLTLVNTGTIFTNNDQIRIIPTFLSQAPGLQNIVEDTSPQLGASLDTNDFDINWKDGNWATFGTGSDVILQWDGTDFEVTSAAGSSVWNFRDGLHIKLWDDTDTDSLQIDHDGTDVNFTHPDGTTTDWNISGITAIQAGTVDADFDAITATSYGGITEANLVDKSAAETVTGLWRFEIDSATTNADIPVIQISATSTGTPAIGIGPSIEFIAETAAGAPGNQETGGLIALEATDVTATSEDFDFVFNTMAAGATAAERMRITSTGNVTATSFNGVALTTGGSAGNFLNETGSYTALTSNATHTGQVTGATALSLDITAITDQPASGAIVATDTILINDGGVLSEATFTQLDTYFNSSLSFGSGTVTSSGTPLNNEVAVFTSGTDIDSDSTFTWDGTTMFATNVTGTNIGGIAQANLVDKSATESITGQWTFNGNSGPILSGTQSSFYIRETDATADEKNWIIEANGDTFGLYTASDAAASTIVEAVFSTARTGTTVASTTFNGTLAADNLSGTNTGDQTITLTGDVTGSGTGSFATTVANAAATAIAAGNLGSGVLPYMTASATASAFTVPFANTTGVASGNYGLLIDSATPMTYTPSTGTFFASAITGTTIGGITEANLVDKTAAESISGDWTFEADTGNTFITMQKTAAANYTGHNYNNELGVIRWVLCAGATTDDDFVLYRYTDAGAFEGTVMEVDGVTGQINLNYASSATKLSVVTTGVDVTGTITSTTLTDNDVLIAGAGGAIEDSGGKVTYDGSSFAAYGDGTATDLHYLGIDTNDRFRFECGTNYGMILYEDNNVSTENSFFYIGNDTVSTGRQSIYFRKGGSDWAQFDNFGSSSRFEFTGPLEIAGTTDHVGDTGLGTDVSSDRIQIWAKSRSLDHEPMITTGDQDLDYTFTNVNVMSYHHDQTTASADPGAGNIRWNSLTPASVTNLYIDDLESTGRDASFMLSNLADGDILTIRATWDAADYLVCSVNGTPTDNTGWWTVPVTIIHSGAGAPTTGDPIHIGVEWAGSQGGGSGTVTSVAAGNGMDFTTITTTGSVTMGTPGSLSSSSTNAVTATSHTHEITSIDAVDIAAGNLASGVNIYQTANPANSAYKVLFSGATTGVTTSGNYTVNFDNGSGEFIYNPNTNTLTVGTVAAALSGNATTATTATNVTVADESADTTCFPLFVTAATGNLAPKTGSNLTFNSSTGHFTATSKSFLIDHPTKAGKKLQYGSLEGPENGVYVRGRLTGSDTIELPDYWTALIDPNSITVNLTPIGSHQELYVADIADNKVVVGGSADNMDFFYTVYAERVDVDKLEIEFDSEDV